jgi:hypothetical protein
MYHCKLRLPTSTLAHIKAMLDVIDKDPNLLNDIIDHLFRARVSKILFFTLCSEGTTIEFYLGSCTLRMLKNKAGPSVGIIRL